jgi:hypothetical protein
MRDVPAVSEAGLAHPEAVGMKIFAVVLSLYLGTCSVGCASVRWCLRGIFRRCGQHGSRLYAFEWQYH